MKPVAILLAAGAAARFGGIKALAPWKNGTLLSQAVSTAVAAGGAPLVVLGSHAEEIAAHLKEYASINNPGWRSGMGSSLACGLSAALAMAPESDLVLIQLVDQPCVTAAHMAALTDMAHRTGLCALSDDSGVSGPPAAIPRRFFTLLRSLSGDKGLKSVLAPADYITLPAPGMMADIDTPQDLASLSQAGR